MEKSSFDLSIFIWPLESQIVLSEKLNYYLDNPRTSKEIEIVKNYLKGSNEIHEKIKGLRLVSLVEQLKKESGDFSYAIREFSIITNNNNAADNYETYFTVLARNWVIIRYPYDDDFGDISTDRNKYIVEQYKIKGLYYTELQKNHSQLKSFCSLLSLMIHNVNNFDEPNYFGESFLLNESPMELFFPGDNLKLMKVIEKQNRSITNVKDRLLVWHFFPDVEIAIQSYSQKIDILLINEGNEKFIDLVGGVLNMSYSIRYNITVQILLLVSILEFLLVKYDGRTIKDPLNSIGNQLRFKLYILYKELGVEKDFKEIKIWVKSIYDLRSNVAHGNKRKSTDHHNDKLEVFELFKIIEMIIAYYLNNVKMIPIIKEKYTMDTLTSNELKHDYKYLKDKVECIHKEYEDRIDREMEELDLPKLISMMN